MFLHHRKKLTRIRQPLQKTPIVSKWYSNTADIIADHFSLLQSQGNVPMMVRLLHRFVRQSWHPTAQKIFLNHRKKVKSYQTTCAQAKRHVAFPVPNASDKQTPIFEASGRPQQALHATARIQGLHYPGRRPNCACGSATKGPPCSPQERHGDARAGWGAGRGIFSDNSTMTKNE